MMFRGSLHRRALLASRPQHFPPYLPLQVIPPHELDGREFSTGTPGVGSRVSGGRRRRSLNPLAREVLMDYKQFRAAWYLDGFHAVQCEVHDVQPGRSQMLAVQDVAQAVENLCCVSQLVMVTGGSV